MFGDLEYWGRVQISSSHPRNSNQYIYIQEIHKPNVSFTSTPAQGAIGAH